MLADSGSDDYVPSDRDADSEDGNADGWDSDVDEAVSATSLFSDFMGSVRDVVAHMRREHGFVVTEALRAGPSVRPLLHRMVNLSRPLSISL